MYYALYQPSNIFPTQPQKTLPFPTSPAFRQMSTLSQHRAIHSAERPYVCEVCRKTFNRVSTLISHRKTHTGLKPHRCHLCNKAFHQKGNYFIIIKKVIISFYTFISTAVIILTEK